MLNALYMSGNAMGSELAVGNETVYMYDRRTMYDRGSKLPVCSSTALCSSTAPRTSHEPHVKSAFITRPCDRTLSATKPYDWHHYSYIPRTFQIKVEKMRKVYGDEDRGKEAGTSRGTWQFQTVVEFPEFLFFEADDRVPDNAGLPIVKLSEEASTLLQHLGGSTHTILMSRGIVRNGRAHVTEGPLVGYDDRITKIDRHKRLAWVKMDKEGSGKSNLLMVGLEIYAKE